MTDLDLVTPASSDRRPAHGGGLALLVGAMALLGVGSLGWVLLDSMNPAADVPRTLSVDLDRIPAGTRKTILWRGMPIFVAHRTPDQIAAARGDDTADMPFPARDAQRVHRDAWLVVVGIDTFRGWHTLSGQEAAEDRGAWDGWAVIAEGIQYDGSGRLRRGPGGGNLAIPSYRFVSDTRIEIDWPIPGPDLLVR